MALEDKAPQGLKRGRRQVPTGGTIFDEEGREGRPVYLQVFGPVDWDLDGGWASLITDPPLTSFTTLSNRKKITFFSKIAITLEPVM